MADITLSDLLEKGFIPELFDYSFESAQAREALLKSVECGHCKKLLNMVYLLHFQKTILERENAELAKNREAFIKKHLDEAFGGFDRRLRRIEDAQYRAKVKARKKPK